MRRRARCSRRGRAAAWRAPTWACSISRCPFTSRKTPRAVSPTRLRRSTATRSRVTWCSTGSNFMQTLPGSLALIAPADGVAYVRGATDVPLSETTIGEFLRDTARRFPDRQAVVFREQGVHWTWKEFDERVDQLAAGLLSLGIAKSDRVAIWSPNRFEWLLTQFATARIGAVLVNINPAYRVSELEYALRKVGIKALVTAEQFKTSKYISMLLDIAPELASQPAGDLHCARLPELRTVISVGDPGIQGVMPFSAVMLKGEAILRDEGQ